MERNHIKLVFFILCLQIEINFLFHLHYLMHVSAFSSEYSWLTTFWNFRIERKSCCMLYKGTLILEIFLSVLGRLVYIEKNLSTHLPVFVAGTKNNTEPNIISFRNHTETRASKVTRFVISRVPKYLMGTVNFTFQIVFRNTASAKRISHHSKPLFRR